MMYTITERLDGRFHCTCRAQDGTEEWGELTRDDAVAIVIRAARAINHDTITEADIAWYRQREIARPAEIRVVAERARDDGPAGSPAEDIGPAKYPPGLKGLLLRLADHL